MVTTKLNLSMTEPSVRQIYAKQGDTGRVLDISLDQTPEDGTLRILRPDGVEVTSEAVTGGEVESGSSFESLTEADVTELTVGIEPVQDLNGYDKPWVGGAGRNKVDNSAIEVGYYTESGQHSLSTDYRTSALTPAKPNTAYSISIFAKNTKERVGGLVATCWDANESILGQYTVSPFTTPANTAYVRVRNFQAAVSYVTSDNFLYQLEEGSSATSYSPYSNICPITGHDEVTITRTGKNLLENLASSRTTNGINYTVNSDGSFSARGTATARANLFLRTVSNPQRLPKGNYILSQGNVFGVGEAFIELAIRKADGTTQYVNLNARDNFAFTLNEGDYIYQPYFSVYSGTTIDATIYPMIRLASETDDAYEPYRSNTYTTSLGQTVYGGTLDMVSGVLTVDRAMVDLGSLSWSMSGSGNTAFFYANTASLGVASDITTSLNYICENYSIVAVSSGGTARGMAFTSASQLRIRDATYSDATSFKTAMNGVQLVYQLATPVEYQLTPQQIKTLVGTNNVWASSGDIVSIKFTYGGLFAELPSDATSVVGKCYCDVEQNGVSSMPFTLNVKKNERES